jgi:hypothetical protein
MRTGHVPLNAHLARIKQAESPFCPHCGGDTKETVIHFILQRPHYKHERHTLIRKLCWKAFSLEFLLSNREGQRPLL